jgi:hypothetical protein
MIQSTLSCDSINGSTVALVEATTQDVEVDKYTNKIRSLEQSNHLSFFIDADFPEAL